MAVELLLDAVAACPKALAPELPATALFPIAVVAVSVAAAK
nr:hypothetical protein [Burkholderia anthina]